MRKWLRVQLKLFLDKFWWNQSLSCTQKVHLRKANTITATEVFLAVKALKAAGCGESNLKCSEP